MLTRWCDGAPLTSCGDDIADGANHGTRLEEMDLVSCAGDDAVPRVSRELRERGMDLLTPWIVFVAAREHNRGTLAERMRGRRACREQTNERRGLACLKRRHGLGRYLL